MRRKESEEKREDVLSFGNIYLLLSFEIKKRKTRSKKQERERKERNKIPIDPLSLCRKIHPSGGLA